MHWKPPLQAFNFLWASRFRKHWPAHPSLSSLLEPSLQAARPAIFKRGIRWVARGLDRFSREPWSAVAVEAAFVEDIGQVQRKLSVSRPCSSPAASLPDCGRRSRFGRKLSLQRSPISFAVEPRVCWNMPCDGDSCMPVRTPCPACSNTLGWSPGRCGDAWTKPTPSGRLSKPSGSGPTSLAGRPPDLAADCMLCLSRVA